MMNLRSFLFFGVIFFSFNVKSEIYTPVNLSLTFEELTKVLNHPFKGGIEAEGQIDAMPQIPDLLQQEFREVFYKAKFFPEIFVDKNGGIHVKVRISEFLLDLKDLHIGYQQSRETNSFHAGELVSIKCESLQISLNQEISYEANGSLNTNPPKVWELEVPEDMDFDVNAQNCEGSEDIKGIILESIIKWSYSNKGRKKILEVLNTNVIEFYWGKLREGLEVDIMGRKIWIAISSLSFSDKVRAEVMIRWPNENYSTRAEVPMNSEAIFSMSSEGFNEILENWLSQGCYAFTMERKDIPGIDELFESGIKKFFAWRDLENFVSGVNFKLDIKLCPKVMEIKDISSQGITIHHKSDIQIEMSFLNSKSKAFPYMVAWTEAEGDLNLESGPEGLSVRLSGTEVDFKSKFHPEMNTWRKSKPKSGPNFYFLESHVLDGLEDSRFPILEGYKDIFGNQEFYMGEGVLEFRRSR